MEKLSETLFLVAEMTRLIARGVMAASDLLQFAAEATGAIAIAREDHAAKPVEACIACQSSFGQCAACAMEDDYGAIRP